MTGSNPVLATIKHNINIINIGDITMKQIDNNQFIALNQLENHFTEWNNANETVPSNSRFVLATDGEFWFPAYYDHNCNEWNSSFAKDKYPEPLVVTHWTDIYCLDSHMDYLPEYHESDNFGSTRIN